MKYNFVKAQKKETNQFRFHLNTSWVQLFTIYLSEINFSMMLLRCEYMFSSRLRCILYNNEFIVLKKISSVFSNWICDLVWAKWASHHVHRHKLNDKTWLRLIVRKIGNIIVRSSIKATRQCPYFQSNIRLPRVQCSVKALNDNVSLLIYKRFPVGVGGSISFWVFSLLLIRYH